MESNFKNDSNNEKKVAEWLDKYFYSKVAKFESPNFNFISKRADRFDKPEKMIQRTGIDIVYKTREEKVSYVDEKAQLDYLNNKLPTFSFEIKFKNRKKDFSEGWFIREDLETTHYLLVYPNSSVAKDARQLKNFEDITHVELLLIDKDKLWDELKNQKITKENLLHEVGEMIDIEKEGKKYIDSSSSQETYLYRTSPYKKYEEPVNIIIKRKMLDEIADAIWSVTKKNITEKKVFKYYY